MLQQMRGFARSWISALFLLGLAATFGLWGIGDIFRGGTQDTSLATVGDAKIQPQDFQRDYRNILRRLGQQEHHDISPEEAHARGIDRKVLDNEIGDKALDQGAEKYGLMAGDAQVSALIRSMGAFRNTLGTFDHNTFVQVLEQNGLSENIFIDLVRGELTRNQLLSAASSGMEIPAGYAKLFFDYVNERRAAEYVTVGGQTVSGMPAPTDDQSNAFLKAHAAEFSTPEYRDITYLSVGPADVANQINVSDAQLRQRYDELKDQYQIPEKRDVEQVIFPDQTSAKAARAKIDAGTTLEDVAKTVGKSPSDISLGTIVQADLGTDRGPPTFALPVGGTTRPIKFTFGWVLLHVTKITPAVNKTFDQAKDTLRKQAVDQLAAAKLTDVTNAFEDARAGGASFTDAGKKVGMRVVRVTAVDRNGLAPDGSKTNLPAAAEFQSQLARAEVGEEGDPFTASDASAYAIKINGVTPSRLKALDSVRSQVTAAWTAEQRAKRLAQLAAQLAQKANADRGLKDVAAGLHTSVQTTGSLSRQSHTDVLSSALISRLFQAAPGTVVFAPSEKGDAYLIARVTGVAHPVLPAGTPLLRQFGAEIGHEAGGDMSNSLANAWQEKLSVKINESQLNRMAGGS